eukprot:842612-Pyramimonas_sp.AAC.1
MRMYEKHTLLNARPATKLNPNGMPQISVLAVRREKGLPEWHTLAFSVMLLKCPGAPRQAPRKENSSPRTTVCRSPGRPPLMAPDGLADDHLVVQAIKDRERHSDASEPRIPR